MRRLRLSTTQRGFTIVELMIALSILSTLLVMSTVILVQLGRLYTKGVNQANTQNTARNILTDISSQLQLSGSTPNPTTPGVVCIGNQRYTYRLDHKLTEDPADHVLWRDTTAGSGACQPLNLDTETPSDTQTQQGTGVELMPLNTRLTDFKVTANANNTYGIKVTVAYGDDDLVQHQDGATRCVGTSGTEYCAVSSLSITVARRIAQ